MIQNFLFQWHITNQCNLRCSHCYQTDYAQDLKLETLLSVLQQLNQFRKYWNAKGHINLTGGEPLVSRNLFPVLDAITETGMTFALLTNGTLIHKETAKKLAEYQKLKYIQVSVDGSREIHDSIRGKGNFDKAVSGIRMLKKYHIPVSVSFTVSRTNQHCLHEVCEICRKQKVDYFWTDRMIPFGHADRKNCLSAEELQKFVSELAGEARQNHGLFRKTFVKTGRALQFLSGCSQGIYHCEAGDSFFTIDEHCNLLPCRRMPIKIGSLLKENLLDLYLNSEILQDLRKHSIPAECLACEHAAACRGGLKCLCYAVFQDYHQKDPNCFYKK